MKMLNVLILANHLDYASGVTTYLKHLIAQLVLTENLKIFIGTSTGSEITYFEKLGIKVFIIDELNFKKRSYLRFFVAFIKILQLVYKNKIKIIHSNDYFVANIANFVSLILGRTRCIQTIHGTVPQNGKLKVMKADHFIFINKNLQDKYIDKWPYNKNRANLIYNGIDISQFLERNISCEPNFIFLCLSRLDKNKGVNTAIDAYNLLDEKIKSQTKFFIVGDGPEKDILQKQVGFTNPRISLFDKTDNPNMYYQKAQVFIMSSSEEGFGYTMIEAALSECFVICSNFEGSEHILRDGIDGFVYNKDSATHLMELMKKVFFLSREERVEYVKNFIERIKLNFNSDLMAHKTLSLYQKVSCS